MLVTCLLVLSTVTSVTGISLIDFFPFGPDANDLEIPLYNDSISLSLPHEFPFMDSFYHEIDVTRNGLFMFEPVPHFTWAETMQDRDGSFVAGFWYSNLYHSPGAPTLTNTNKVYYGIHNATSSSNISVTIMNKVNEYVRLYFPQQSLFTSKMVIIGTWYFIGYFSPGSVTLNNTFQVVLCTDEDRSFVFFLYHELQWANIYNSGYYYSDAGIRNSLRNESNPLPNSGTADIVKLVNESNVQVPGLFAFRLDASTISEGGCNENTTLISFRPRTVPQLGSSTLIIYNSCFTNNTKIKCRFNSQSSSIDGFVIDKCRAACLTPVLPNEKSVLVEISVDDGNSFISAGYLYVTPVKLGSDEVTIENIANDVLFKNAEKISLSWRFPVAVRKLFPRDVSIDIELWKVNVNNQSELQKESSPLILAQNLTPQNLTSVTLPKNMSQIALCFIRVVAHANNQTLSGVNTGLLVASTSQLLSSNLCRQWAAQQNDSSTWNGNGLLQCPMTRQQAIFAGRCCYKPDAQCSRNSASPQNCWLHKARPGRNESSAVECYTSISSNVHGAGAECCYDENENLITRGRGAGTDDRYQHTISPLKHFLHDTLPYLHCCMMSNKNEDCSTYMYFRPPRRGSNTMGDTGRMWGDPHFGTLDGSSYTFNGYGEYIYLAISDNTSPPMAFDHNDQSYLFISQVRTEPLPASNVTVTKGFAARSNRMNSKPISLTISHRQKLLIHYDNESFEFEDNVDTVTFSDLIVNRLSGNNDTSFRLSWDFGVTVHIKVITLKSPSKQLVLSVGASVAETFHQRTYGLLGTYDGDSVNDLRSSNGTIVPRNSSLEDIHKLFGMTWAIVPQFSLFHYEATESPEYFKQKNTAYIPSFVDPTNSDNQTIRSQCKIDANLLVPSWNVAQRACFYDLSVTHDTEFAKTSLEEGNDLLATSKKLIYPIFDSNIPLQMNLTSGDEVVLNISASTENNSSRIELITLHLPHKAVFNSGTGVFRWKAMAGDHHFSVKANDTIHNLVSRHEIAFSVKEKSTEINGSNDAVIKRINAITPIFFILVAIFSFY